MNKFFFIKESSESSEEGSGDDSSEESGAASGNTGRDSESLCQNFFHIKIIWKKHLFFLMEL